MTMEWILIAGALCLSNHHDVCIKHTGDPAAPYSVVTPLAKPQPTMTLDYAKHIGESSAKEPDEFPIASSVVVPWRGRADDVPLNACVRPDGNAITGPCQWGSDHGYTQVPQASLGLPPVQITAEGAIRSFPYGMTKDEFGQFIEDHTRQSDKAWSFPIAGDVCQVDTSASPDTYIITMCPRPKK